MIQGELNVASVPELPFFPPFFLFLIHWKCWKGLAEEAVNLSTVKKGMVVEQEMSLFNVPAPKQPAGAGVCSQPFSLTLRWLVNGPNKYVMAFSSTVGCEEAEPEPGTERCEFSSQLTQDFCTIQRSSYSLDMQMQIPAALWEASPLPWTGYTRRKYGSGPSCPSVWHGG